MITLVIVSVDLYAASKLDVKYSSLIKQLNLLAGYGITAFNIKMLKSYFPAETDITLRKTLTRAIDNGLLRRVCRGIYIYPHEFARRLHKSEEIAVLLRPGQFSYISLETALSEYGIISQVTLDYLTVMTTGRSQTYSTPYGVIEFTHTSRQEEEILADTVTPAERPLRLARPGLALADLRRVRRNLDLINMEVYEEIIHEQSLAV